MYFSKIKAIFCFFTLFAFYVTYNCVKSFCLTQYKTAIKAYPYLNTFETMFGEHSMYLFLVDLLLNVKQMFYEYPF